mgnify:FL=1
MNRVPVSKSSRAGKARSAAGPPSATNGFPDPYRVWLRVRGKTRPPNAYELLNLEPYESDAATIRAAAALQRMALATHQAEAPPEVWEQIYGELEQAIATLLDPTKKEAYDAALRVQEAVAVPASLPPAVAPSTPTGRAAAVATLRCPACQAPNPPGRKFCSQCGKNLWDLCYQCGALVTAGDRFCGACGADLLEGLSRYQEALRQKLAAAEEHFRLGQYDAAIQALTPLAENEHASLRPLTEQARQCLDRARQQAKHWQEKKAAVEAEADALLARRQYRQAQRKLEEIPPHLRSPKMEEQLAHAAESLRMIDSLGRELRALAGSPFSMELVRLVGRLLALDPEHSHARQVMERINRRLQRAAEDLLAQGRYDEAARLLDHLPPVGRTGPIEMLYTQARELARMARVLADSPVATPGLVGLAARFCRMAPDDPRGPAWQADLCRRLQNLSRAKGPLVVRLRAEGGPGTGAVPVAWLAGLPGLTIAPDMPGDILGAHPGRFAVACGLALEALGEGQFSINLQAEEPAIWKRVWRWLNQRPARSAWGLDLGTAALKAVKLMHAGRNEAPRLAAADVVEHRKPLSQATGLEEIAAIVEESLGQLAARNDLHADRISLGLPQSLLLIRGMEMPLFDSERMAGAMAFEARRHFPVPMTELVWDYVVANTPQAAGGPTGPSERAARRPDGARRAKAATAKAEIWVVAAKRLVVQALMHRAQMVGLRAEVLQAAPLGLGNLLVWLHQLSHRSEMSHRGGVAGPTPMMASMDLGCEAASFVAAAPGFLWLRSAALGASRVAHQVARGLRVPLARAETWVRNPAEADSPAAVLSAVEEVFDDYRQELAASLGALRAAHAHTSIGQVLLLGGGMLLPGLLAGWGLSDTHQSQPEAACVSPAYPHDAR